MSDHWFPHHVQAVIRLLKFYQHDQLGITGFDEHAIPPYAILSHTWGVDEAEHKTADLETSGKRTKPGCRRIWFYGQQSKRDGQQYFWVGLCCNDNMNSTELSEAISVMYSWYRNPTRYDPFLSNISVREIKINNALAESTWKSALRSSHTLAESSWKPALRSSRWLPRYWMPQESSAPATVKFPFQKGRRLGKRKWSESFFHNIMGIHDKTRDGIFLSRFDLDEQMLWIHNSVKSPKKDRVHALKDLLSIEPAPVYGDVASHETFGFCTALIRHEELHAQDQNDLTRKLNASDVGSELASIVSPKDSIWSYASLDSTVTGFSAASGYSAAQIKTATKELLPIFLEHDHLASPHNTGILRARIGPEKLQRNIWRLLKALAQDLEASADKELEKLAVRLVSYKAAHITRSVIERYETKYLPIFADNLLPLDVEQRDDGSSDEEVHNEAEEEDPEGHIDEDFIRDLSALGQILADITAFAQFERQLKAFVHFRPDGMKGTVGEQNHLLDQLPALETEVNPPSSLQDRSVNLHNSHILFSKSKAAFESLFIAAGFLEPPLDVGMVRIRWRCRCGERFFGDLKECRADGVQNLIDKMRRSTGSEVTVTSHSETSTNQKWVFKAPAWIQRIAGTFSSLQTRSNDSTGRLPQHNAPNYNISPTSSTQATNIVVPAKPTLHLLSCTHQTQRRKCLLQDPIGSVSTDRALFCFMKQRFQNNRRRIRNLLAMRSVQGMFFVKFRLRMGNNVEVRDHNPCCTSTNPSTCECIPPGKKVEPSPDAEYRCSPAGPLATWPPVLSQDLMHMLSSPQCINEQETWVFDQVPKRTVGELQACVGQPAEGWGIYYQEGFDFDMIISVIFVVFLLSSLLFAILWTRLEMDIQGAFGVSSYMATASGILLAWVASRAKNFG